MKMKIAKNTNPNKDLQVLPEAEKKYAVKIRENIGNFIESNAGGYPKKNVIVADGEEYEVRVFLSLDPNDRYYFIGKWLDEFLSKTSGKMIPLALDSEDNVYCINNETEKVYYWSLEMDTYYCISPDLSSFVELFNDK